MSFAQRWLKVKENVQEACRRCGRSLDDVVIVGVTKYARPDQIQEALDAGLQHVAENKVQDAAAKFALLNFPRDVTRHMIGHLQTNKVKRALGLFDWIDSVDRPALVETLAARLPSEGDPLPVLIQVNTSGEPQKYGCEPDDLECLFERAVQTECLRVEGLMTLAPLTTDEGRVRSCFVRLREGLKKLKVRWGQESRWPLRHLSMGMTQDYIWAVEEGSTMVRIGRALFGEDT